MFIKRVKPTSNPKRHLRSIDNHYLPVLIKKKVHKKMFRNTRGVFLYKKSKTKPSLRYYNLKKGIPLLCPSTSITSINKVTYSKFFVAQITTGCGVSYPIKLADGANIKKMLNQKNFGFLWKNSYCIGERGFLYSFKTGSICYSLRLLSHHNWVMSESAGTFCKILWHRDEDTHTAINTPAKQFVKVNYYNTASFGRVSNLLAKKMVHGSFKKAKKNGRYRLSVRGVAMNPVDHPNGGRTNTKRPLKNPWNRPAKKGK